MAKIGRPKKGESPEALKAVLVRMPLLLKARIDAEPKECTLSDWIIDAIRLKLDRFQVSGRSILAMAEQTVQQSRDIEAIMGYEPKETTYAPMDDIA